MIDERLAAAGVIVFGAFWVLLLTISGRSEKALTASLLRLETAVASFTKALADHDASPLAHTAASEHNHAPMEQATERIETKLDALIQDHIRINAACGNGQRVIWDGVERRNRGRQ